MSEIVDKFIKDYETDLIQISITERKNNGLGILLLNIVDNEMKCQFLKIDNETIPKKIKEDIINMYKEKNSDVYFYFNHESESKLITLDLDKRNVS